MEAFVRPRWSRWIKGVIDEAPISQSALARLIGNVPANRVGEWLDGRRTVSARSAFFVGEQLAVQGYRCGGVVSLHAAGYIVESLHTLQRIAWISGRTSSAHAVWLYCELPVLNNWVDTRGNRVTPFLESSVTTAFDVSLEREAWEAARSLPSRRKRLLAADSSPAAMRDAHRREVTALYATFGLMLAEALFESEWIPRKVAAFESWIALRRWAIAADTAMFSKLCGALDEVMPPNVMPFSSGNSPFSKEFSL